MKKRFLIVILLSLSMMSYGQVFKCIENGKTVYSQQPCSTDTTKSETLIDVAKDPATFDIAGIKLGMTEDQVINALILTLKIDASQIKRVNKNNSAMYYNRMYQYFQIRGNINNAGFEVEHVTGNYLILFWSDLEEPNKKVVVEIVHKMKSSQEEDLIKIRNTAVKKYGKPTKEGTFFDYQLLDWCGMPVKKVISKKTYIESCASAKKPYLSLVNNLLILKDGRYTEEMFDRNRRY